MGQRIKAGDVVFIRGKGLISWLVKWIDQGEFSHVVIALSEDTCISAEYGTRVSIIPFEYEDYEVIDLHLTERENIKLKINAELQVGKRYDYGEILYILLKRFFRYKGTNRFNSPNNYICSELVDFLLRKVQKIPPGTVLTDCTPNQLYSYLKIQFDPKKSEGDIN